MFQQHLLKIVKIKLHVLSFANFLSQRHPEIAKSAIYINRIRHIFTKIVTLKNGQNCQNSCPFHTQMHKLAVDIDS